MTFTEAEKERFHEQDLKRIKNFRPIDDTFMRAIFRENLPLAQHVLRVVTGLSDHLPGCIWERYFRKEI